MDEILTEANASHAGWLAKFHPPLLYGVDAVSNRFAANDTERALVQQMGANFGCHTCNQLVAVTPQHFIVDHIPPRGLFNDPTAHGITYLFFPHCDVCAMKQAALVKAIRAVPHVLSQLRAWRGNRDAGILAGVRVVLQGAGFTAGQIALVLGGAGPGVAGHGGNPTPTDRTTINTPAGVAPVSCHSCGSTQALFIYHADHCPPKEFAMTSWFPTWIASLAATPTVTLLQSLLARSFFRPQCPGCSHSQGGRCNSLVARATIELQTSHATTTTRGGRTVTQQRYGK